MLESRIEAIRQHFGVELIDYGRPTTGVVLSSGCGIGLAIMDQLPSANWFVDIDRYRHKAVDWECLAVVLTIARPRYVVLAGWFTIDKPWAFHSFKKGSIETPLYEYSGGGELTLSDFLKSVGSVV